MGIHRKGFFSPFNFNETHDDTITGPCELCEAGSTSGLLRQEKERIAQNHPLSNLLLFTPHGYHSSLLLEVVIS